MAQPFVISDAMWAKQAYNADGSDGGRSELRMAVDTFCQQWDSSSIKTVEGRCQKSLNSEDMPKGLAAEVSKAMGSLMPDAASTPQTTLEPHLAAKYPALAKLMQPSLFAIASRHKGIKYELREMGCVRWQLKGIRQVVILPGADVVKHLGRKHDQQGTSGSARALRSREALVWSSTATHDDLSAYSKDGGRLWCGSVCENDFLYVPAGCVCGEYVTTSEDAPCAFGPHHMRAF